MKLKINKTYVTIYKTTYENKETVQSKPLCLQNLGFLNKIHIASSLIKSKILLQCLIIYMFSIDYYLQNQGYKLGVLR